MIGEQTISPTPVARSAGAGNSHRYALDNLVSSVTGATYVNFLDLERVTSERVRAANSPEDWDRLVDLKDRYDPDNTYQRRLVFPRRHQLQGSRLNGQSRGASLRD